MGRAASFSRPVATATISIDIVLLGCSDRRLHAVVETSGDRVTLPWGVPNQGESLDAAAGRIARRALGEVPRWIEQLGAFTDGGTHPASATLSVCYVGVIPFSATGVWKRVESLSSLPGRQRRMLSAGVNSIRSRLERAPIAFSMLPKEFTLSELQLIYETILGRRLHKASFRRTLHAAFVVEPTAEWRSEGRGRPAQLYRYTPRRRKGTRRGVRIDLL